MTEASSQESRGGVRMATDTVDVLRKMVFLTSEYLRYEGHGLRPGEKMPPVDPAKVSLLRMALEEELKSIEEILGLAVLRPEGRRA